MSAQHCALTIPELTTARLRLRLFRESDFEEYAAMMADPDVAQFLGAGPLTRSDPEGFPAFEIGYALARHAWGRGYAREGAAAALQYAREVLRRREITSIIRPNNSRSIRVAESLGAVAAETVQFFGAPSIVYRYPAA